VNRSGEVRLLDRQGYSSEVTNYGFVVVVGLIVVDIELYGKTAVHHSVVYSLRRAVLFVV